MRQAVRGVSSSAVRAGQERLSVRRFRARTSRSTLSGGRDGPASHGVVPPMAAQMCPISACRNKKRLRPLRDCLAAEELWEAFRSALGDVGAASDLRLVAQGDGASDATSTWKASGRRRWGQSRRSATWSRSIVATVQGRTRCSSPRRISRDVAAALVEHNHEFLRRSWATPALAPAAAHRHLRRERIVSPEQRGSVAFETASLLDVALAVLDGVARQGVWANALLLARPRERGPTPRGAAGSGTPRRGRRTGCARSVRGGRRVMASGADPLADLLRPGPRAGERGIAARPRRPRRSRAGARRSRGPSQRT
jgi:hypothetical protein